MQWHLINFRSFCQPIKSFQCCMVIHCLLSLLGLNYMQSVKTLPRHLHLSQPQKCVCTLWWKWAPQARCTAVGRHSYPHTDGRSMPRPLCKLLFSLLWQSIWQKQPKKELDLAHSLGVWSITVEGRGGRKQEIASHSLIVRKQETEKMNIDAQLASL